MYVAHSKHLFSYLSWAKLRSSACPNTYRTSLFPYFLWEIVEQRQEKCFLSPTILSYISRMIKVKLLNWPNILHFLYVYTSHQKFLGIFYKGFWCWQLNNSKKILKGDRFVVRIQEYSRAPWPQYPQPWVVLYTNYLFYIFGERV